MSGTLEKVYLGLGTNLGDRRALMCEAISSIRQEIGEVTSLSSFIETEPWGFESEYRFLNAVIEVETDLQPLKVLEITQDIERRMGRVYKSVNGRYADRTMDIDILLFGQKIIQTEYLTIPHPRMLERSFVMIPLCEIASSVLHPILKRPLGELKKHEKL